MKPRASVSKRGVFHLAGRAERPRQAPRAEPAMADPRHGARTSSAPPATLIALNKPYGVICQFSRDGDRNTLADYIEQPDVYPAGRLDTDSEGLLLLTNQGALQHWISSPAGKSAGKSADKEAAVPSGVALANHLHQSGNPQRQALLKTYWVQVEGEPDDDAIARLRTPLNLGDFVTAASAVRRIPEPANLWPRDPPIRYRAVIPTSWLEVTVGEGKNRQVRRMTAAVGHPTLRLIRAAIGPVRVDGLPLGAWRNVTLAEIGYSR